jgi:hypothetical protein
MSSFRCDAYENSRSPVATYGGCAQWTNQKVFISVATLELCIRATCYRRTLSTTQCMREQWHSIVDSAVLMMVLYDKSTIPHGVITVVDGELPDCVACREISRVVGERPKRIFCRSYACCRYGTTVYILHCCTSGYLGMVPTPNARKRRRK